MSYIDGFVLAVPKANRDAFIKHATTADAIFLEHGALRVLECWQDDVPKGKTTDFYGAVKAKDDEETHAIQPWLTWKKPCKQTLVWIRRKTPCHLTVLA